PPNGPGGRFSATGLLAVGQQGSQWRLLVEDGVAVAPTGDQPRLVQGGQLLGDGAGGELVPPGQGVGGGWFGERFQQGGPSLAEQAPERLGLTCRDRLPQLGDPPGRVDRRRLGGRIGDCG